MLLPNSTCIIECERCGREYEVACHAENGIKLLAHELDPCPDCTDTEPVIIMTECSIGHTFAQQGVRLDTGEIRFDHGANHDDAYFPRFTETAACPRCGREADVQAWTYGIVREVN